MKTIPQISFVPSLNSIPKQALKFIMADIAALLWKGRPMWRSRDLLFGVLAQPHLVEPFLARAFRAVMDSIHFLKQCDPLYREMWK